MPLNMELAAAAIKADELTHPLTHIGGPLNHFNSNH